PYLMGENTLMNGTDYGLGGGHSQVVWAKLRALRDGAAIASKKLWSLNSKALCERQEAARLRERTE
ncbi:MAG: hypothetical protein ACREQ7_21915, partial [Candidatus Binatia bacterium]